MALLIGGFCTVLLSILLGWMLTRALARPIGAMTGTMNRLASGDNSVEVLGLERRDEVGEMAKAVQTFKDAAIEKIRLEREAESQRSLSETERAQHAKEQATVVNAIATGLEKLSSGDLTYRVNTAFAAEYEKLRTDFNAAMERLQETMKIVASNAAGIRSGTGEITQASDDLSRRTEQQAANLEETAAALDEITATVRKTADGANQAREVVSSAKADAEHSGQVVRDAVAAMSEIEKSAQQIGQIIGVIDEIAFQTNLLALNAGVEAARAGDAGRGFAVVASEVRALAQRSAEAAKEIKTLISASSQQVGVGVELVGETGKALQRIVTQVADINGVVGEIASSAAEQATGLQQVNTAVQPDGPGDPAERRHGRTVHRRGPRARPGNRRALASHQPVHYRRAVEGVGDCGAHSRSHRTPRSGDLVHIGADAGQSRARPQARTRHVGRHLGRVLRRP